MTPGEYNFPAHRRGDTFYGHTFTILEDGDPVDFTDAIIKIQFRKSPGSPVVLEWLTSDDSLTIEGAGFNVIRMEEKEGSQMNVEPDDYKYDINVLLANGVTNTYVYGILPIVADISR